MSGRSAGANRGDRDQALGGFDVLATSAASASICRPRRRAQPGRRIAPFAIIPRPTRPRNATPGTACPSVPLANVATIVAIVTPTAATPALIEARAPPL